MRQFSANLSLVTASAVLLAASVGLAQADSSTTQTSTGMQQQLPQRHNDQARQWQPGQQASPQQPQTQSHHHDHHGDNDNDWRQHDHRPDVVVIGRPHEPIWPVYRERRPLIIYQQPAPVFYPAPQPYVIETPIASPDMPVAPTIFCSPQRRGLVLDITTGAVMAEDHGWAMRSGGTILGLALGNAFGGYADSTDQTCVAEAAAYAPIGQTITWSSNSYGTEIEVLPLRDRWMNGLQCRDYETHVLVGNAWRRVNGTSCRQVDGSWFVVQ